MVYLQQSSHTCSCSYWTNKPACSSLNFLGGKLFLDETRSNCTHPVNESLPGLDAPPLRDPQHIYAKLSSSARSYTFIDPLLSGCCCPGAVTRHLAGIWPPARTTHVHETKRQRILVTRLRFKLTEVYCVCSKSWWGPCFESA